ncbi:putative PEX20 peroxisomal biogenesis factor 20 [Triangularia verruculosa]|uniref:PEX20 peroxisomal biogenesis factor 20 n=1 Tax=Triangularia verruculosa TaxID=2587418 RepID=A0AAN6XKA2_9PEZI|nr:putative PEX20 peroxisomal biogenesis factor 20 [Triangularia verruculosa]
MADSMCGPSNGAKNLLAHTDRDRTLHQDRLVNAPQAGPGASFRSQNAGPSNTAENAFQGFQQGGPVNAGFEHAPLFPDLNSVALHHPSMAMSPAPMTARMAAEHHAAMRLESPATGGIGNQAWVNEFASMKIANGTPIQAAPITGMAMSHPGIPVVQQPMLLPTAGLSGFAPYQTGMPFQSYQPNLTAPMTHSQLPGQEAAAAQVESAEVKDAFADLFDQYEQQADQLTDHQRQEQEFEQEQAKWMAEHGPQVFPPTDAEMAAINSEMERIADEQDEQEHARRRENADLARAAEDILRAVSGNNSDKFKHSNFLELMRRIAASEIVVNEENFIDADTGEKIETGDLVAEAPVNNGSNTVPDENGVSANGAPPPAPASA